MLYLWNLPQIYILIRSFIRENLEAQFIWWKRGHKQKKPENVPKNPFFGPISTISNTLINHHSISDALS